MEALLQQSIDQKNLRQAQAAKVWADTGFRGSLLCGTGWGKTKAAVLDCLNFLPTANRPHKTLVVVNRENDRDITWPEEIDKHNPGFLPKIICWASVHKENLYLYDYLILDEIHHITDRNYLALSLFKGAVLGLTATMPTDEETISYIMDVAPPVYEFGLEKGIMETINAPYDVSLIMIKPDTVDKNIKAGTKVKPFFTTEQGQLEYLDKAVQKAFIQWHSWEHPLVRRLVSARMKTIYNSVTKRRAARHILQHIYSAEKRILVFCGSEEQVDTLLPKHSYHSGNKKTTGQQRYKDFLTEKSNLLGTVRMLDESANIPNLDIGLVAQATSSTLQTTQRINKPVRFKSF